MTFAEDDSEMKTNDMNKDPLISSPVAKKFRDELRESPHLLLGMPVGNQ